MKASAVAGHNRLLKPSIYHAVGLDTANPGAWGRTPDSFTGFCMLHLKAREILMRLPWSGAKQPIRPFGNILWPLSNTLDKVLHTD